MRVALAMLTLVPGEMGGSERYVRELARRLPATSADAVAVLPEGIPTFEGLPTVTVPGLRPRPSNVARLGLVARVALRPGKARRALEGADLVHYPFTTPVPSVRDRPTVVTLLDVQHLDRPELFGRAERVYRRFAYDGAARAADAVIVISEYVRERAVATLGLDGARVHAIPLGVDTTRFRPGDVPREPFLLYPARAWPHKNHDRLFAAFALLREQRPTLRLVLTGARFDALPAGVECRGQVSDDELADLYRRASALVFPSLYEGFGLPVLEAMASGCPVAASTAGALPEVCGDAAILFDPRDPSAIAAGIEQALDGGESLGERGLARVRLFTWDATVRSHVAVYEALAA